MLTLPFHIEKSIVISKPIDEVYSLLSYFKSWPKWSPWLCLERDCHYETQGQPGSIGHTQKWAGSRIGSGSMVLTEAKVNESLEYDLSFVQPWKSQSKVHFFLSEEKGQTKVLWTMQGSLPFFLFFLKRQMQAMIGNDYRRGLTMLKDLCETGEVHSKVDFLGQVQQEEFWYIGIERTCEVSKISEHMELDFKVLMELSTTGKIPAPQKVLIITKKFDFVKGRATLVSALAFHHEPPFSESGFVQGHYPSHKVLKVHHTGTYKYLGNGWAGLLSESRATKMKLNKSIAPYEIYVNDPRKTATSETLSELCLPVK